MKPVVGKLRSGDPQVWDGWKLTGLIGEGGFSTIYLGEKDNLRAAIKIIRKEFLFDQESVDRFFTEIKNLELLNHPNIERYITSSSDSRGVPYFAVEYIDGPDLETQVRNQDTFKSHDWLKLASDLAKAINYCHSQRVIHKDVSPGNIVMGDTGPILIDFGLSYLEQDPRLTSREMIVGTPPFMAPEHIRHSENLSREMDIFSLAGTLIFSATGHYPFNGRTKQEWMDSILYEKPNFDGLSSYQIKLLEPLLYKNPQDRLPLDLFISQLENLITDTKNSDDLESELATFKHNSAKKLISNRSLTEFEAPKIRRGMSNLAVASFASIAIVALGITFLGKNGAKPSTLEKVSPSVSPSVPATDSTSATPDPTSPKTRVTSKATSTAEGKATNVNSRCQELVNSKKYSEAVITCKESLSLGNSRSDFLLGEAYRGLGDNESARKHYFVCFNRNEPDCMYEYAFYLSREGKTDEARNIWKQAFSLGNAVSAIALGVSFKISNNNSEAISWWKKAVDAKAYSAEQYLSDLYKDSLKDYDNAMYWAKRMLQDKVPGADQRIGLLYQLQGNTPLAKQYWAKCGDDGNVSCMSLLGITYYNEKDGPSAVLWAGRAANKGFVPAMNLMTRIYSFLLFDPAEAKKWAQKSSSQGDLEGTFSLGGLTAIVDNDMNRACLLWSQVILKANSLISTNKDQSDTQSWLDKATDQYTKHDCKTVLGN